MTCTDDIPIIILVTIITVAVAVAFSDYYRNQPATANSWHYYQRKLIIYHTNTLF